MYNMPFADKIIQFNSILNYTGSLPKGFEMLNPFKENPETMQVIKAFYEKFDVMDICGKLFCVGGLDGTRTRLA